MRIWEILNANPGRFVSCCLHLFLLLLSFFRARSLFMSFLLLFCYAQKIGCIDFDQRQADSQACHQAAWQEGHQHTHALASIGIFALFFLPHLNRFSSNNCSVFFGRVAKKKRCVFVFTSEPHFTDFLFFSLNSCSTLLLFDIVLTLEHFNFELVCLSMAFVLFCTNSAGKCCEELSVLVRLRRLERGTRRRFQTRHSEKRRLACAQQGARIGSSRILQSIDVFSF